MMDPLSKSKAHLAQANATYLQHFAHGWIQNYYLAKIFIASAIHATVPAWGGKPGDGLKNIKEEQARFESLKDE